MAKLERIVNVSIALNTAGISKLGFSTILVAGYHTNSLNRVDIVTDVDDLIDMGFSANDSIYKAVACGFSQIPRPKQIKVGRLSVTGTKAVVTAVNKATYTITAQTMDENSKVTTVKATVENTANSNATTIASELAAQFASTDKVTAVVNGAEITFTLNGTVKLTYSDNIDATVTEGTEELAKEFALIRAEDSDFYGVTLATRNVEKIKEMAEYAETQTMLFGTSFYEDGTALASSKDDTLSVMKEKGYMRTFVFPHVLCDDEYLEVGVMARCFAISEGGETWALKTIAGVTADNWTETQAQAIFKKVANTYEKVRNVKVTQNGKVLGDEWIDVIRFRDWLQEEIATEVFLALKNSDKLPYTDAGIAVIESIVRACLERGQTRGGIAPAEYDSDGNENKGFTISVPLSSDISTNDKAQRILNDIKFTARLAGAIHVVNITGNFTYSNLIETDNTTNS